MPLDPLQFLEKCGLKSESLEKIRLGQGVVGKTSYVVGLAIIVLGVIACRATNEFLLAFLAISIVGLAIWHPHKTRSFAKENPSLALLEGAELIAYQQIELASKGFHPSTNEPSIANPVAATQLPDHSEENPNGN